MKLPDFSKCVQFKRLKEEMGVTYIPNLPPVKFLREITEEIVIHEPNRKDIELGEKLKFSSVDVEIDDVTVDKQGLLEYKGRKVVAYIRDQRQGIDYINKKSSYRYHLCNCSTMIKMRNAGRINRYLVTKRCDEKFEVYDIYENKYRKLELKLNLCHNCEKELRDRGLYDSPFSLKKYLEKYDSYVPKDIRRIETVTKVQTYQPNQEELSKKYREASKFTCQKCMVDCSSNHSLLHLHHKDGVKSNNKHENLCILCVDCHSKEFMHAHIVNTQKAKLQLAEIKKLRKQQGIIDLE